MCKEIKKIFNWPQHLVGAPTIWSVLVGLVFSGAVFSMNNNALAAGGTGEPVGGTGGPVGGTGGPVGGTGGPVGGTGGPELVNPLGTTSIVQIINNVLNYLIYISVPILAIMILVGGFQILTARDNPEKIGSGRKTIMYAVVGFTIILISKGVALIILKIMG